MPLTPEYLDGQFTQRPGKNWPASQRSSQAYIAYRKWGTSTSGAVPPVAANPVAFANAVAGLNAATLTLTKIGRTPVRTPSGSLISGSLFGGVNSQGQLDCPRNVTVTATGAVAVSGIIYGHDEFNRQITENWTLAGAGTFTGKKAFGRVDAVTITSVADATAITVSAGFGNVLGLPARSGVAGVNAALKEQVDGAPVTTGTLVAASTATTDDAQGTYLPATAPNGVHVYEVWFLVNDDQI